MQTRSPHNWVARLRRFMVRREVEHCDFCSIVIPPQHSHLLERATRRFLCACQGCAFSLGASERYCLISPRSEALHDFILSDADWMAFQIPIEMVFLFRSTSADRLIAIYPSPAGATESQLSLEAWSQLIAANPVLADFHPDVEALLVNRTNGAREYYRVSIDRCYSLVGLIRKHWRGLSGGAEAWDAIDGYFARLRDAAPAPAGDLVHG